jgi:large subunit ribosomal protein L11
MAKNIKAKVKLTCPGGQANPSPPVGPALGQHGVNIGEFVKRFNDSTRDKMGIPISVVLTIYDDRKFDMIFKGSPVSFLLKQAAGIAKGSGVPNQNKVGKVTKEQVIQIAEDKREYLNANTIEGAARVVEGTARSMGIEVVE